VDSPYNAIEHQQYVNTLIRLIETRRMHQGNEDAQKEADMAIRRMRASVVQSRGDAAWAAIEGDAEESLSGPRRTESGLWLV
jgi:hypothetical protein